MFFLKGAFDRLVSLFGLFILWPILLIVAVLIKIKMPGGPVLFVQKRVGKDGKLFNCHKFRTMTVNHGGSTVSVAGDRRITPLGASLRHYKLDELPGLWDVLIGNMSFVGPRPDVPGYADKLEGDDRDVLKLRPGITGPATLKYRLEDEMIAEFIKDFRKYNLVELSLLRNKNDNFRYPQIAEVLTEQQWSKLSVKNDQEIAEWYNDNIIYPDKVRLNCYYYRHYSFWKDIEMIFATVLKFKVKFAGEYL